MKKTISQDVAGQLLVASIENPDFSDRVYEFAQNLCNKEISKIEAQHIIVDADGDPFTEDDGDGQTWYDDYRDEFIKAVFEKITAGDL